MIFRRQILSLLLFLPVLVFAQVTELKTEPDRLQALCTAFLNGNMDTLLLHSSPEMKQAIEDGKLALVSLQISTMFGKLRFLDGKPQKTTTVNGITIFVQTVRLERQELNCFLSIDPNGKLCGFYIRPQQKKKQAETEPPPGLEKIKTGTESSFIEREVKIGKSSSLPGTLTLPRGNAPYPALILIHGSGPNDRDETVQANKPFRDLAELLAERNIAVLRYDKRTFVHPEEFRNRPSVTINDETVNDVLAAIDFLRNIPEIDSNAIWLLGHSLGGMMLPRIASKTSIPAGYVFAAAPATSLPEVMEEQGIYLLNQNSSLPEIEKQRVRNALRKQTELLKNPDGTSLPGQMSAYWKDLSTYDQASMARQIKRPMLFLQGKRDFQVQPHHLELWKKALHGLPHCSFILYDDLNHLMQPGKGMPNMAEYAIPSKVPAKLADDIASFLRQTEHAN